MKTLTLLTTLALVASAFGQATNTNRGTVQVPQRPLRSESTNVAPVPTPGVPLRGTPAAAATNLTQAATNLVPAATNIAATATNPAAATATGAVTTTTTTTATNRAGGPTTLQPSQTNVVRPSLPTLPTPAGTRPGTPATTAAAAGAATTPTTTSPATPITAVSTNASADDVIIPPGLISFRKPT